MTMEIISSNGDSFRANTHWTTDLVAELWNAELKLTEAEIGRSNITWQRISNDLQGDIAWNLTHGSGTQGLTLSILSCCLTTANTARP